MKLYKSLLEVLQTHIAKPRPIRTESGKPVFHVSELSGCPWLSVLERSFVQAGLQKPLDTGLAAWLGTTAHEWLEARLSGLDCIVEERLEHDCGAFVLTGQPDAISGDYEEIVDWKFGRAHASHATQLNMYAFLAFKRYGTLAKTLANVYLSKNGIKFKKQCKNEYAGAQGIAQRYQLFMDKLMLYVSDRERFFETMPAESAALLAWNMAGHGSKANKIAGFEIIKNRAIDESAKQLSRLLSQTKLLEEQISVIRRNMQKLCEHEFDGQSGNYKTAYGSFRYSPGSVQRRVDTNHVKKNLEKWGKLGIKQEEIFKTIRTEGKLMFYATMLHEESEYGEKTIGANTPT